MTNDDAFLNLDDDILDETTILDPNSSNNFSGTSEDENIIGGNEDDTIRGAGGDDIIIGAGGNNLLVGNGGDDTLSGAGINLSDVDDLEITLERQGIDTLTGGTGSDRFVLGANSDDSILDTDDSFIIFYNQAGNQDYALITDFDSSQDKILLGGSKNEYRLGSSPTDLPEGTGIFRQDELIAIVEGTSDLSLSKNYFEEVST
jgi:Ca2+-binding RTX toxin-like protein